MLNKIEKFKGFDKYIEGVSRWSNETDSYLFGVSETGVINNERTSDGDGKEREYYRFEYSRLLSAIQARNLFIDAYMEYHGCGKDEQMKSIISNEPTRIQRVREVLLKAEELAKGIN